MRVKLEDIIEQIELANEESKSYLNKSTGEIHLIPDEVESYLEEDSDEDDLPEWEIEIIPIAKDILANSNNYIQFPNKFDINEYSIMEKFSLSITEEKLRDAIYSSLKGSGAFRRFKNIINEYGIEDKWYKYKNGELKEFAIEWCKENNLEFY